MSHILEGFSKSQLALLGPAGGYFPGDYRSAYVCDPTGRRYQLPSYMPVEWAKRIVVEIDSTGKPHYLWTGWNNGKGHAKVRREGKAIYCHRDIIERVDGVKLDRFDYVDHKCRRKPCLNYDCLEVVPPGENTRRGPGAQQQFKPAAAYLDSAPSPDTWVKDLFLREPQNAES